MKTQGSYKPKAFEFEVINNGITALLHFYENIQPYETLASDGMSSISGWEYDRYTLTMPYDEGLRTRVEANLPAWLTLAKQTEHDTLADEIREKRNALITETDWTQAADAPINDASKEALRLYRQALRDIPEQEGFPYEVQWPVEPAIEKDAVTR